VLIVLCVFLSGSARPDDQPRQQQSLKQGLDMIKDFAAQICTSVPTDGSTLDASGEAKLKGIFGWFAGAGIAGKADYQKYSGVLRQDLAKAMHDANDCRLNVFYAVKDRILGPSDSKPAGRTDQSNSRPPRKTKAEASGAQRLDTDRSSNNGSVNNGSINNGSINSGNSNSGNSNSGNSNSGNSNSGNSNSGNSNSNSNSNSGNINNGNGVVNNLPGNSGNVTINNPVERPASVYEADPGLSNLAQSEARRSIEQLESLQAPTRCKHGWETVVAIQESADKSLSRGKLDVAAKHTEK
jgi:hypothetical protein